MALGEYLGAGAGTTKALRHFNEASGNANDSSGNGVTLTNTGTTPYIAGKFGNCINTSSGKYFTHTTFLDAGLADWTCSFWFKTSTNYSGGAGFIIDKTSSGYDYPCEISINTVNKLDIMINDTGSFVGGFNQFVSTQTVNDGIRHNGIISGSRSGGRASISMWIDGNPTGSLTNSKGVDSGGIYGSTSNDFTIGARGGGGQPFTGQIDEIIWENYQWTAAQKRKYYTYASGKFGIQ